MNIRYNWEIFTHDFTNLSIVHRRHVDGHMFSMHQSGTHWLKNMLVSVICTEYDVPVPDKISDTTVIGSSRDHTPYKHIPNIFASHNIPSPLAATWLVSAFVKLPPRVLLIRDIRSFAISHYAKCKNDYGVTFSEYLRGDPSSERFDYDVWLTIRFLNAWGRVLKHYPDSTHLVRYESLTADPVRELEECCTHYGIRFKGTHAIEDAVTACTKDAMEKRQSDLTGQVVRRDSRPISDWYNEEDRHFFSQLCSRYLKYNFGYEYNLWD